jgi:outer membrane protein W
MKKLVLAGAIALFGLSNAQIAKGTTYISGTVSYAGEKNNEADTNKDTFKVIPTVGYFVGTNLAVGLGVGYQSKSEKSNFPGNTYEKTTQSAFVVEPFVRKYWNLGEKLYFFGQLSVPMAFGTEKYEATGVNSDKTKFNSFGVAVKPGLDYMVNKNWSFEATIGNFGYQTTKGDYDGAKSTDNYNFGLNLKEVQFGVKYIFGK